MRMYRVEYEFRGDKAHTNAYKTRREAEEKLEKVRARLKRVGENPDTAGVIEVNILAWDW